MKDESFGAIIIFIKNNKILFLIVQHKVAGHWSFPKGHKEGRESDLEAAKREVEEEVGIKDFQLIDDIYFIEKYTIKSKKEGIEKTVKYYLAKTKSQNIILQEEEIKDAKWLEFEDAYNLLSFKEAKNLLEKVKEYIDYKEII